MASFRKDLNPGYDKGNHWVVCDRCGVSYRNKVMKKTWDGLVVCPQDWERRHTQDLVRGVKDDTTAKGFVRPEGDINYVPQQKDVCTSNVAKAGIALVGCAQAGVSVNSLPLSTFDGSL